MVNIAQGLSKVVTYKKEDVAWGELPSSPTGANTIRRVTASFSLNKETYASDEIRVDYQMSDYRHGVRSVEGSVNGELSPGSYADFIESALAKPFVAGASSTALDVDSATAAPQFVLNTGSWFTEGYKVGEVVRFTGFATATENNNRNFLITALTATDMTGVFLDGTDVGAELTATVNVSTPGAKTWVPESGHTSDSYTFEEWYSDIAQSEVFTGNKVNTIGLSLPATGMSTIDIGFMGKDREQTGTSQYFTSPVAQGSSGIFAAVNGALVVDGAVIALVTSLSININRNITMEPVVGSNVYPDTFDGRCIVDGEFSYFFTDGTLRDYFDNETEVSLVAALTTSNEADADFMTIVLPRIKVNGSGKDDGEKGIVGSAPFQALKNEEGGVGTATENTTIVVQDSAVTP